MPVDRTFIGHDLGVTGTFPVEWGKIRELATAILDDNPLYHEAAAAKEGPFGAPVAPPTYTMVQAHWGGSMTNMPDLGLDVTRVLHGEQEYEYRAPLLSGDTLTARARIADIAEKEGKRGGTMTLVTFETEFTNQRGEVAVVGRMLIIETAKAAN